MGLSLCAGIITGLWISPGTLFYIISALLIITGFCSSLFFNKQLTNIVFGISLSLALWLAGMMLYKLEKGRISGLAPEEAIYKGILDDIPEEKEKSWKMIVRLGGVIYNNDLLRKGGSLLIYHRKTGQSPPYLPGDELIIRCTPAEITNRGNPGEFDYRFYMENQGIRYFTFTDSSDILRHTSPHHRKLKHTALIIREKILDMFLKRGIGDENLGLVAAMTLGQKNLLDPEQKQYFMKAGVMHIMAVSGLHTVILSLFIFNMLFFLKGKMNIVRVLITLLTLWAFAFITGLTPSVLRATLMFSFLQAGKIMKRPVNAVNSILASAFILILIRPSVIFDAGFLLSYSAVIFIICFYRDLYLKISFRYRIPDLIWQSAAVSIIAQAGTLPLTVMLFNRFPVWFILSNIIVVPLSSLVVITGVLVLISCPLPILSRLLAWILEFLTRLTEKLTETAASLPLSTIENIGITSTECILLTITLFLGCRYLLNRKSIPVLYPLTALLFFMAAGTIQDIPIRKSGEIIVYNTINHTVSGIRTGRILNCYTDTLISEREVNRHKAMFKLREERNMINGNACVAIDGGIRILITGQLTASLLERSSP
ncbi:MAG TPA: hypothetical protein DDW27_18580, partial [Bacteroidales bacterium]|nr:hypothetical protein [Bacteroidales bacterium]